MANLNKITEYKWFHTVVNNPKKFYLYSMIFLTVSFIGAMIQGVFFPSDTAFRIKPPILYSKSETTKNSIVNHDKKMEKIVNELKTLKVKRDERTLDKNDSMRIKYLFNQYQTLKNGH